jgi:P27 family predicted phage terminase small subunit
MNSSKQKKISSDILDSLRSKGLFENSDQILIDELLYQQFLISEAKKSIKANGILVNVRADGVPLLQVNQAVSVYRDAVKSLITLCTKLGITPQERSKLKLIEKKSDFDLVKFLAD